MRSRFTIGVAVQTTFGKGVVREVRNNGRLLVDVQRRALVVDESEVSLLEAYGLARRSSKSEGGRRSRSRETVAVSQPEPPAADVPAVVDLHGLTVAEALARAEQALNEALLADAAELRLIHGRSGGRIRAALHRRLGEIPSVRRFTLDPANEGVTIVRF